MKIVSSHKRLLLILCVLVLPAVVGLRATASRRQTAAAPSANVVISQIYGGGGNSGATLKNDFIELFNPTASSVDVSNWSIQYAAANGATWQVTNLCASGPCTIAPGHYFLIQEAA